VLRRVFPQQSVDPRLFLRTGHRLGALEGRGERPEVSENRIAIGPPQERRRVGLWRAQIGVAGAIALLAAWWLMIRPSNMRDWQPEVVEAPYAEIDGDRVVIYNFRK
jgi:anti-sigma-K factor RskA